MEDLFVKLSKETKNFLKIKHYYDILLADNSIKISSYKKEHLDVAKWLLTTKTNSEYYYTYVDLVKNKKKSARFQPHYLNKIIKYEVINKSPI